MDCIHDGGFHQITMELKKFLFPSDVIAVKRSECNSRECGDADINTPTIVLRVAHTQAEHIQLRTAQNTCISGLCIY